MPRMLRNRAALFWSQNSFANLAAIKGKSRSLPPQTKLPGVSADEITLSSKARLNRHGCDGTCSLSDVQQIER